MYRKVAGLVIGGAAAINSATVAALGLGEMTMRSALHEPLDAEIKVTNVDNLDPDQIKVRLADQKTFDMAGVDRTYFLSNLRFNVTLDGNGNATINVTTKKSVKEPFLDFLIEVRWPTGKVVRSYTALVDLPIFNQSAAPVISSSVKAASAPSNVSTASSNTTYQASETVQTYSYNQETPKSTTNPHVTPDGSYRIKNNDTLFEIAKSVRPDNSYSINKTMLALQKINPEAFPDGNINRIKAGSILRIPTAQEINAYSTDQAAQIVSTQNKVWRGAQLDSSEAVEEYQAPENLPEGHLSLTSAGESEGLSSSLGEGEGVEGANADSLAVSEMDNAELSNKVTSLTDQINQLERLIELKDAELASLQAQLGQQNAGSEPASTEISAVDDTVVTDESVVEPLASETLTIDQSAEATEQETFAQTDAVEPVVSQEVLTEEAPVDAGVTDDIIGEASVTAEPIAEVAAEPSEEAIVEDVQEVVSEASSQSALMDKLKTFSPIHLGLFGLFIASLAAAFAIQRRNKKEREAIEEAINFEFAELDDSEADTQQTEETTLVEEPMLDATESHQESTADAAEPVILETDDALSEADIYIAYGRYDQAVSLLENAIGANEDTVPLRNKLLSIYLESGNQEGFTEQYRTAMTQGLAPVVTHAKDILSSSEHADWLSDVEDALLDESDDGMLDLSDDLLAEGDELSLDATDINELAAQDISDIDFDESLLEASNTTEATAAFDVNQPDGDDAVMELEFDLSEVDTDETTADQLDTFETLDIDGGDSLEIASATSDSDADVEVVELDALDSLDTLDIDDSVIESKSAMHGDNLVDDSIEALAELTENAFTDEQSFDDIASQELDIGLDDSDLDFIATTDEVATKLDLARAYIDMGDFDGAKDMLKEVIEEGEGEQKEEANTLLESCG
ncbi:MAG: hypothetical protein OXE99_05005 [Cellvibrionales bacterium]|nr:hypothetical protein [Cellvibrionales bacterium]